MSLGKNTLSYKKQSFQSDTNIGLGFKDLIIADQMVGGETYIDLTSLTVPTSMSSNGFTNPLSAEILDAKIFFFKENVSVIRSAGGMLIPYDEFQIISSSRINITTPALPNEIFTVVIRNKASNGMMGVDGRVIRASGLLAAGLQDINVGQEFAINAYPASQIGEVMLFIDGQIQFRNVSNATASPSADGNYEEVPVTGGFGSILRMNTTELYARNWLVVSTAVIVQRPDGSRDSALESLAGQVDRIIPTLAEVAGVDESVFQGAPNYVQQKIFGDQVLDHESRIAAIEAIPTTVWGAKYRMQNAGVVNLNSANPLNANLSIYDKTGGAISTGSGYWLFTSPIDAWYRITCMVPVDATNTQVGLALYLSLTGTGTVGHYFSPIMLASVYQEILGVTSFWLPAGGTAKIQNGSSSANILAIASVNNNFLCIERIGIGS